MSEDREQSPREALLATVRAIADEQVRVVTQFAGSGAKTDYMRALRALEVLALKMGTEKDWYACAKALEILRGEK